MICTVSDGAKSAPLHRTRALLKQVVWLPCLGTQRAAGAGAQFYLLGDSELGDASGGELACNGTPHAASTPGPQPICSRGALFHHNLTSHFYQVSAGAELLPEIEGLAVAPALQSPHDERVVQLQKKQNLPPHLSRCDGG